MIMDFKEGFVIISKKSGHHYEILKIKQQTDTKFEGKIKLIRLAHFGYGYGTMLEFAEYYESCTMKQAKEGYRLGKIINHWFHKPNFELDIIGTLKYRKRKAKNGKL